MQRPDSICCATSSNNSAGGCESASMKISQSPEAAAAPQFRARAIWFCDSNTTVAPAARAISPVRSVELLSHTINSLSHLRHANDWVADWIARRESPINRSSLNAGMTIEMRTRIIWWNRGVIQIKCNSSHGFDSDEVRGRRRRARSDAPHPRTLSSLRQVLFKEKL